MEKLETERLIIRRFNADDFKDLYDYLSKEDVVLYEPYGVYTLEDCKQEAVNRSKNPAFWAVCLKDTNKVIGNLYFEQENPQFSTWEIGYVFNSDFQGNGYATEACLELLKYGFETLNCRRIIAMCNPNNTKSWRLLERLKLRREAHMLQTIYFKCDENGNPIWHDTYLYAMLKSEWVK